MSTDEELARIEARLKGITAGPWHAAAAEDETSEMILEYEFGYVGPWHTAIPLKNRPNNHQDTPVVLDPHGNAVADVRGADARGANAKFIANARTDIPRLIAMVRQARRKGREEVEADFEKAKEIHRRELLRLEDEVKFGPRCGTCGQPQDAYRKGELAMRERAAGLAYSATPEWCKNDDRLVVRLTAEFVKIAFDIRALEPETPEGK